MSTTQTDDGERDDRPGQIASVEKRYVLLDPLGRGGSADVYTAFDRKLDRKIAIKLIRDTAGEARLLREAQALARIRHPNVVTVFDAGMLDDRVFLAMELVEGQSLRGWLDAAPRSWREILPVFLAAGRGLAAVHAAGLVHRDFKPDNVLVGADGTVRVADFGLVRRAEEVPPASEPDSPLAFDLTATGAVVGTPRYMPPEQYTGATVDTRSDQFAYCATLHQALYGQTPFAGDSVEELRVNVTAGRLRELPAGRRTPSWLDAAVRRGLAGAPADRWPSMEALLDELGRDRGRLPRRLALAAALLATLGVLVFALTRRPGAPACAGSAAGLIGVWDAARKAEIKQAFTATGKPYAADTFQRVTARLDAFTAAWVAMRDDACQATAVRHEQSEALLDLRMECLDSRRAQVAAAAVLFAKPDVEVLDRAVQIVSQLDPLEPCADRQTLSATTPLPGDPAVRARVVALEHQLDTATVLARAGKLADSGKIATLVLAEARILRAPGVIAAALFRVAHIDSTRNKGADVDARLVEAIQLAAEVRDGRLEVKAWTELITAKSLQGRPEAAADFRVAADAALARIGNPADLRCNLLVAESKALRQAGRLEEARRVAEQALALAAGLGDACHEPAVLNVLALAVRDQGNLAEAGALLERARAGYAQALGPTHPYVGGVLINLGSLRRRQGDYAGARAACEESLAILEASLGPDDVDVASALSNLAGLALAQRHPEEAERLARRSLAIKEKRLGAEHLLLASSLESLAKALGDLGRCAEARAPATRAIALREKASGAKLEPLGVARLILAKIDLCEGHIDDAGRGIDVAEKLLHLEEATEVIAIAEVRLAQHRPADARAALDHVAAVEPRDPLDQAELELMRARVRWELEPDHGAAEAQARAAIALTAGQGDGGARMRSRIEDWLKTHAAR